MHRQIWIYHKNKCFHHVFDKLFFSKFEKNKSSMDCQRLYNFCFSNVNTKVDLIQIEELYVD